jgi:multidrug efflux pump subunit AcrA (membrane-fusion protein)
MKQHITSLPHHPKRVIIISLIIAFAIGIFGYIKINKKMVMTNINDNSSLITNNDSTSPRDLTLGFLASGRIKSVFVKTGDTVKKGQVLAELDSGSVKGALIQAQAAYEKIINGATSSTIDIAKATVNTATINLDEITKQQDILVENAHRNFLSSTLEATPKDSDKNYVAPIISGNYILGKEGVINLHFYYSTGGISFTASGLINGSGIMNGITSQPVGDSGLYIKSTISQIENEDWVIEIPNKKASNYLANYNAYQLALQTKSQAIALAQATLDQAKASLTGLVVAARPEDVAQSNGALEIAQANYNNTIIIAPADGKITSVVIIPGQIAIQNASAIELITNESSN